MTDFKSKPIIDTVSKIWIVFKACQICCGSLGFWKSPAEKTWTLICKNDALCSQKQADNGHSVYTTHTLRSP